MLLVLKVVHLLVPEVVLLCYDSTDFCIFLECPKAKSVGLSKQ